MSDASQQERIMALLTGHQRRLMIYIRSLVPNRTDAEEILQEVNLHLWRHANELRAEENFAAWADHAVRYQVLTYRKRLGRHRARFSDAIVDQLSAQAETLAEGSDRRQSALEDCLKKLSEKDRGLILARYAPGATVAQVAAFTDRSAKAIYESLDRIRRRLFECIERTLTAEERRP
jgi:RNA polymerase sigma-70 factor (ECF subfamily)